VTEALEELAARFRSPRLEGSALQCRGLLEENIELLGAAIAIHRRSRQPMLVAEALEDAGLMLGRSGRLPEPRLLMEQALAICERAGAQRDAARILAGLRSLGSGQAGEGRGGGLRRDGEA